MVGKRCACSEPRVDCRRAYFMLKYFRLSGLLLKFPVTKDKSTVLEKQSRSENPLIGWFEPCVVNAADCKSAIRRFNSGLALQFIISRDGGIGRRTGLKIPGASRLVRVQVSLPAPHLGFRIRCWIHMEVATDLLPNATESF